jgi:ubiquitin carboxyl-terminal hydrolase 14
MVRVTVKWGKEQFDVEIDAEKGADELKAKIQEKTRVPMAKQKIMGVKGGQLKDDVTSLVSVGVTEGKSIMLIGSAEELPPPPEAAVFAEDVVGGFDAAAPTTNGLVNVGNTCYMNAAIQTLRLIPELREVLASPSTPPLGKHLLQLFDALEQSRDAVAPMQMWLTLMATHPNFGEPDERGRPMQHDSQEALSVMLQVAVQEIARNPQLKETYGSLFNGSLTCLTTVVGQDEPPKEEMAPFGILTCNISGEVQTLEAGLEQAFEEVITTEGNDAQTLKRVSRFASLPEYMFVHMVRFQWRRDINAKAKILKPITLPLVLDVISLCTPELKASMQPQREHIRELRDKEVERRKRQRQKSGHEDEPPTVEAETPSAAEDMPLVLHNDNGYYELCAVISHKGRDSEGGHYVAWVLKAGTWLVVDDNNSAPVSVEDVLRLRGVGEAHIAYVLLYRSRDPVTKKLPLLL